MKSSCISHPERERLVIIRKSQVEFCEGNQCAAAVMSYLEYWHNWKLDSDEYNKKANDVSEMHNEKRQLSEDIYQFHSMQEISDGILNLYGIKLISDSIKFLESKNVISTHANPNPNYFYDKKKYFKFYPDVYNNWLKTHYKSRFGKKTECTSQKEVSESAEMLSVLSKNAALLGKNAVAITEINNKDKTNINNANDGLVDSTSKLNKEEDAKINLIIELLTEKGLSAKHVYRPDNIVIIQNLCKAGATVEIFSKAYDLATKKANQGFGLSYLVKVVESALKKSNQHQSDPRPHSYEYIENDISQLPDWAKGE
jgi:hypothetical protein